MSLSGDVILALIMAVLALFAIVWRINFNKAQFIDTVYANRGIVYDNIDRLLSCSYIAKDISIEKLKLIRSFVRQAKDLDTGNSYVDRPQLHYQRKHEIVECLRCAADILINQGVPSNRIYEYVTPSEFESFIHD